MRRLFGLLAALCAVLAALLAAFGMSDFGGSSGTATAAAASPAQQIGMRVLVITDSNPNLGAATPYNDWVNTLNREGVPFDSMVANSLSPGSVPLPALSSTAANGTQVANYQGVVVALSGPGGLTTTQWATLQTFEQHFNVRQITAYAVPSSDYGLTAANPPVSFSGSPSPSLTTAGKSVFPYLNPNLNPLPFDPGTFGYEGTPAAGANVNTLITGPNGSSLLGIYTSPDGRQTMYQTFNENPNMIQSQLLRHGELDWLTRNTYFGDQRNYLETNIDDNFLSDDSYTPGTGVGGGSTDYNPNDALRETATDVTTAANWSKANNFRIDMLYNGGGSQQYITDHPTGDPLLAQFQADKGDFGWINHTWDHPNVDQGCANQAYIQSEITQNTTWATGTLGLGTSPTSPLGNQDPAALVTGEHSGLANLIPGNPGTVDPPEFNEAPSVGTDGTLAAGTYQYAISDQFTDSTTAGESTASTTSVTLTTPGSVTLTWDAVCHAADYKIYRLSPNTTTWVLLATIPATSADFGDTGPVALPYKDTGAVAGTTVSGLPATNTATESPYQQNTFLTAAFTGAGIQYFGSDASKPYPTPPTAAVPPTSEYPAGSAFTDGTAMAIPRYPTNIYYNASTEAQEVNEYETIYDSPTCVPITGVTTCNGAGTHFTMSTIVGQIDQNMFLHMMGNDPRPHYFHQTNLMGPSTTVADVTGTPPATLPSVGDGLYYETMNPLLAEYHLDFDANAPIEQPTMAQIGTLLNEQAAWGSAKVSQVTGSIEGDVVTVTNTIPNTTVQVPLTGTTGGASYAGTQSYWTPVTGTATFKALAPWPTPPTVPVQVRVPGGPAPGNGHNPPIPSTGGGKPVTYYAVQTTPKTVNIKKGTVTVSLKCQASRGKTPKGKLCSGNFTLNVAGQTVRHSFRFKSGKVDQVKVALNKRMRAMAVKASKQHKAKKRNLSGKLVIVTKLSGRQTHTARGTLTVRT